MVPNQAITELFNEAATNTITSPGRTTSSSQTLNDILHRDNPDEKRLQLDSHLKKIAEKQSKERAKEEAKKAAKENEILTKLQIKAAGEITRKNELLTLAVESARGLFKDTIANEQASSFKDAPVSDAPTGETDIKVKYMISDKQTIQ